MNSKGKWPRVGAVMFVALLVAVCLGLVYLLGPAAQPPAARAETWLSAGGTGLAAPAAKPAGDVPAQAQGQSCIEGTVVDRYHTPVPGWTVHAALALPGGPQYTTVTDARGRFVFSGLVAGTWTLSQDLQEGWQPVTPATFEVTVDGRAGPCAQVRFKNERLVTVIGKKTECKQGMGLAGWVISAIPHLPGGQVITATTNGLGQFQFTNLIPGTWTFREEPQVGWEPYSPASGQHTLTLVSPQAHTPPYVINFVNNQVTTPQIRACKLDELGRGLAGWRISVRPESGTRPPIYGTTGRDGCVVFKGLDFGTWIVEEHPTAAQRQQWNAMTPTQVTVQLTEPGQAVPVVFQNKPCGCVRVRKINTLDQGLEGWTIYARDGGGKQLTQITDQNGYATFYNLDFGPWTFWEEQKDGWEPVTPAQVEVPVSRQAPCEQVLFKNRTRTAMLVVYKKDWNGKVGLPGWTITIQPRYGGAPQSKVTDGTGRVEFTNLAPGWYEVSEGPQSGWVPVTAARVTLELKVTGVPAVHTFWNRQTGVQPTPPGPQPGVWYTVQAGDTLTSIAARYGVDWHALAQANGISYPYIIYVGQRIYIP